MRRRGVPPDRVLMNIPLVLGLMIAGLALAANGVGWIAAGHALVGCGSFLVRGYMASFVYGWFMGDAASDVTGREAAIMFGVAMLVSAVSAVVLAYVTRAGTTAPGQQTT
jgi:hypothetical protein